MRSIRLLTLLAMLGVFAWTTSALAEEPPAKKDDAAAGKKAAEPAPDKKADAPAPEEKKAEPKKDPPKPEPKKDAPKADKKKADSGDAADELDKLIDQASSNEGLSGWADKAAEKPQTFPRFEHHGYFRFRADLFHNGHLNTVIPGNPNSGTSAILPPLIENVINNDGSNPFNVRSTDAKTIAYANLRFRYQPSIHISQALRIHATMDIMDNLVLGSTPDFAPSLNRPDVPLGAFTTAAASPNTGVNSFQDSVRIKELYAEWQPAFLLRVGRMASHWGLGMLANSGREVDNDFGDFTDRALLVLKLYGVYIAAAYDFVYEGATTMDPADNFGQPKDLGQDDDVYQWVVSIFQRPLSAAEQEQRKIDLLEKFKPQFDWGVYVVTRIQDMDLSGDSYQDYLDNGGLDTVNRLQLVPRRALAVIPDLHLKYEQRFNYFQGLRLELEAAMVYGQIDNVNDDSTAGTPERNILQWGVAFEGQYDHDFDAFSMSVGVDAGAASGDSAEGFGIFEPVLSDGQEPNRDINNFRFDRDYFIDLIMFREVIGAVTNAVYVKPWVSFDFFSSVEEELGVRADLLLAWAQEPEATPGNEAFYGFEADVKLFYRDKGRFSFDLEAGFLLPGGAFNYIDADTPENSRDAEFAFTVQSRITLIF